MLIEKLVMAVEIEVIPSSESQALLALEAYARFGKGQKSEAKLNFCDCMTYALAREAVEPLLFKGDDFVHTDLLLA